MIKRQDFYYEWNMRFLHEPRERRESSFRFVWFAVIILLFNSFTSCSRSAQSDKLLIAVSIPPQAWFVSQITGDKAGHPAKQPADILILVPPGQNPHNYEPTPKQIQSLSKAKAWILSGAEFEIILRPKIEKLFPDLLIIDGTEGVDFRYLTEYEHDDCDDPDHDHDEAPAQYRDRHTWLGYEPAIIMAMQIASSFVIFDNANSEYYFNQMDILIKKIDGVFKELIITLAPLNGKSVFVYHPSFGYFLDEFGIIQEAVEVGGKEPTPRQLNELMEKVKQEKPAAIFVQKQFPVNAAKTIAGTVGAKVIELDPLAQDWLKNIKHMGQELRNTIK